MAPAPAQANKKLAKKMLKDANELLAKGEVDSAIERLTTAWELVPSAKVGKSLVAAYDKKGDSAAAAKFVEAIVAAKAPKKLVKWAKKKKKVYAKTLAKLGADKAASAAAAEAAAAAAAELQARKDADAKRLAIEEAKARADARAKQKVKPPPPAAKPKEKVADKPPPATAPAKAEADAIPAEAPKKAPAAAAAPADPEFDEDMESTYVPPPDPTWTFFGYTAAGIAVAAVGAGTFFLIQKNSRQTEANDCAADADVLGGRCAQATYRNITAEMDSAFTLEVVSWTTAVLAAGASFTLFALAPPAELTAASLSPATLLLPLPTLRVLLGPGGALLSGSF